MPRQDSTEIILILDRSGSMSIVRGVMEEAMNEFVSEQKKLKGGGTASFTMAQFDTNYEMVHNGIPIQEVPRLRLQPRGMTALFDAVGRTIDEVGARLASMPESDRPEQVLVTIITDGQENASKEYINRKADADGTIDGAKRIREMIEHQREKYSWEFLFLGANQDSFYTSQTMGISSGNTMNYESTSLGVKTLGTSVTNAANSYRTRSKSRSKLLS